MIRLTGKALAAACAFAALTCAAASARDDAKKMPAMVRVVHGSPDAGPVTVSVDGKPAIKNFLYGTVTPYIALKPGTYALAVTTAGGASVKLSAKLQARTFYSVVATGEISPKASPKMPNIALTAFVDAPFAESGSAIDFHHAAPVANASVPFGYGLLANPLNNQLGTATFGTETGPLALPKVAVNDPLELYAVGVNAITLIPNQVDPKDFRNVLPAPFAPNLSVFAIDGPGAAADPDVAGSDAVRLVGIFDGAGM